MNKEFLEIELKHKINGKIKDIEISPLFEQGKTYNINPKSLNYYQEDEKGTLVPSFTHCYITWKKEYFDADEDIYKWAGEAEIAHSLEEANEIKEFLSNHK